jgi:hypothetical protein
MITNVEVLIGVEVVVNVNVYFNVSSLKGSMRVRLFVSLPF